MLKALAYSVYTRRFFRFHLQHQMPIIVPTYTIGNKVVSSM